MVDILNLLSDAAKHHAARPAVVDRHGTMSVEALAREAEKFEVDLSGMGLRPGDTVVLRMGQSRFFAPALLGAWRAGLRVAIINAALPTAVAGDLMAQCEASAVIAFEPEADGPAAAPRIASCGAPERHGTVREAKAGAHFWAGDADREALIVFSSGSTGMPKGIVHTWRTLGELLSLSSLLYPRALDLFSVPLAGLGGVQMLALSLRDALPLNVLADLSPVGVVTAIERLRPAHVLLFPALIAAWVAAAVDRPALMSGLRSCHSGGDGLSAGLHQHFLRLSGVGIAHAYGMAECGPVMRADPLHPTVFLPLAPGRTAVSLDADLSDEASEPVGELLVRTPALMKRYLSEPGSLPRGEPFRTGELFRQMAPDHFEHVGRVADGHAGLALKQVEEMVRHRVGPRSQVCVMEEAGVLKIFLGGAKQNLEGLLPSVRADVSAGARAWHDVRLLMLPALPLGPTGKVDRRALKAMRL